LHANQRAEQNEEIRDIPPGNKALMGQNGRALHGVRHCQSWSYRFRRYEAFLSQVIRLPSANTVW
jgi:hypothetical protein